MEHALKLKQCNTNASRFNLGAWGTDCEEGGGDKSAQAEKSGGWLGLEKWRRVKQHECYKVIFFKDIDS